MQARKLEALGLTDHVDGVVAAGKLDSASIDGCEPTYEIEHLTELVGIIDVSG